MKYEIVIKPSVHKDLNKINSDIVEKIFAQIETLAEEPRQQGHKKLKNPKKIDSNYNALYRVRVGDYRIVYAIEDKIITVTVVRVRHRKDVYE
jgi:mRNA interferase RelE/StbE